MATQIRVQTQDGTRIVYLDLSDDQPMTANFQFKDIQDFKSNKGNHTFNFRIPSTPNNNLFFADYFEVTSFGSFNPKKKTEATISKDTIDVFSGYIQLTNVFTSDNEVSAYECVVFSSVSTLGQILEGKLISEFDWTEYSHNPTPQLVQDSMNRDAVGLFGGDMVYSLYDYGSQHVGGTNQVSCTNPPVGSSGTPTNPINVRNLKPQIRVNKVVEKILNESDFTYTSDFLQNQMNDLYMDINSGGQGNQTILDANYYRINVHGIYPNGSDFLGAVGQYDIKFATTTQPDYLNASGQYDSTTGIYSPAGLWNMSGFQISVQLNAGSGFYGSFTFGMFNVTDNVMTQYESGVQQINNGIGTGGWSNGMFSGTPVNAFDHSKEYKFVLTMLTSNSPTTTVLVTYSRFSCTPASDGWVGTVPLGLGNNQVPYDATIEYSMVANLPKIKAIDFITSLAKKFNLVIIPDEDNPTHLYIEPYSTWIEQGNELNWTDKLDTSKDIQLKPTVDLQAKNMKFTDAQSTDFMNSMFESSAGRIYGTQNVDNSSNDFGKELEEIKTIFKPVITSYIPDTEIRYCVAYGGTSGNIVCEEGIRLSFYCGYVITSTTQAVHIYLTEPSGVSSVTLTSFALLQNYKDADIVPSTECLTFTGEVTGALSSPTPMNSAYSVYYKRFIEETYSNEARLLKGTFHVSALDIMTMNFNDLIFVKNEWFRINKISNYPLIGEGNCQVELIKVERVNQTTTEGVFCDVEPNYIDWQGVVHFVNTSTYSPQIPSNECCESFGYAVSHGNCIELLVSGGNKGVSGDQLDVVPPTQSHNIVKGLNNVNGTFVKVMGSGNTASADYSDIKGFFNYIKIDSSNNSIKGDHNTIDSNTKYSTIKGNNNELKPYELNHKGSLAEVFSRQTLNNNSIQGDYSIALGSGEQFVSGGADALYNKVGRSGSGVFVKHTMTFNKENQYIGQNGEITYTSDYFGDQARNYFRLEFPSMISFEISVVGHERGTIQNRSQLYSFRKYSGVINNTNNAPNVSLRNTTLDIQKESSEFANYDFNIIAGNYIFDGVYITDGMFCFQIDMSQASSLNDVDWTIDFKYTLLGLQNIGRSSGQQIFIPTSISGCLLWVDSSQPNTITHSGGAVSQWDDLSGNNHHLTQPTSAWKPVYSQSISDSYVSFSGVNQVLGNQDSALINVSDGDNTIFVVYKSDNTTTSTAGETIVAVCQRTNQYYGININNTSAGSGGVSFMNKSTQDYGNRLSVIPSTTKQVVIGTRKGTSRSIFDQDGNTDTDTNSTDTAQDTFSIGATYDVGRTPKSSYSGKVYETIVYNSELTPSQINQVQNYLQTKWNT